MAGCAKLHRTVLCELALLLCLVSAGASQNPDRHVINPAKLDKVYVGHVQHGQPNVYHYSWDVGEDEIQAIRINTSRNDSFDDEPLFVVVRQKQGVVSWSLPMAVDAGAGVYLNASRTACPNMTRDLTEPRTDHLYVDVSTTASFNISYELYAHKVDNFTLTRGNSLTTFVTPSAPLFFIYHFEDEETDVRVLVDGDHKDKDYCNIVSVQNADCPVYDLGRDIQYRGDYQTMTTKAGVLVQRSEFPSGSFLVVIAGLSDSGPCRRSSSSYTWPSRAPPQGKGQYYVKELTIRVEDALATDQYVFPVLMTIVFFLGVYLIAVIILVINWYRSRSFHSLTDWLTGSADLDVADSQPMSEGARRGMRQGRTYGALRNVAGGNGISNHNPEVTSLLPAGDQILENDDEREMSHSSAFFNARDGIANKSVITVEDLSKKSPVQLYKKYRVYPWLITTVAVFYALPVVQLVMAYQRILNDSGDQDTCYYNFRCIHPLGTVSAFNNVFSNIGYILLGFLFILITYRRSRLFTRMSDRRPDLLTSRGIPQHYGLFYALGLALATEGVMSGCYHVCPTGANFQFDTSFMYVIAGLCILKIYQNRHPDIGARAHTTMACFAVVIVVAVFGVLYNSLAFWAIFFILYLITIYCVSHHIYYFGTQSLCEPCRMYRQSAPDGAGSRKDRIIAFLRPRYFARFCFVSIAIILNLGTAVYGISTQMSDFATYFLAILVSNLVLYMVYYAVMKLVNKERVRILTIVSMLVACVMWAFAGYFFFAGLTNWKASPAKSREGNRPCILMDFYDHHDIWHFLSGFGLFFTLLALLTVDDDIISKPRSQIFVF